LIANEPPVKIIGFIIFIKANLFDQGSLGSLAGFEEKAMFLG